MADLKLWICSGETLPPSLVKNFFTWFDNDDKTIANLYGSTEVMGDVTFYLVESHDEYLKENVIPIGKGNDLFNF